MKLESKIQLIVVGESCVGKTSLLYKYSQGCFTKEHLATLGIEFFTKEEEINGRKIRVKIWDTAGQEYYRSITKNFYRNSDGVIIVYDVTDRESFEKVQGWVQTISEYTDTEKKIQKVLVANKVDLTRKVTKEEGMKLAEKYNIPFFEASAKLDIGIKDFMTKILTDVLDNVSVDMSRVTLDQKLDNRKNKKKCC